VSHRTALGPLGPAKSIAHPSIHLIRVWYDKTSEQFYNLSLRCLSEVTGSLAAANVGGWHRGWMGGGGGI